MKKLMCMACVALVLNACAYTQTSISANNNGVFGAVGSTYRW